MSLNSLSARSAALSKFGSVAPTAHPPTSSYVAEIRDEVGKFFKEQRDKAKTPEAKTLLASQLNSRADTIKALPADMVVREGRRLLQRSYGAHQVAAVEEFLQGNPQKAINQAREHGPRLYRIANTVKQEYGHKPEIFQMAVSAQGHLMNLFYTMTAASRKAAESGPAYVAQAQQELKKTLPPIEKHFQTEVDKAPASEKPVMESQVKLLKAFSEKSSQVLDALSQHLWQRKPQMQPSVPTGQPAKPSTVFFKATFTETPQ